MTFDPTLIQVFAQRLQLREEDIIRPEHPETLVARGAALAVDELFPAGEGKRDCSLLSAISTLDKFEKTSGPVPESRPGCIFRRRRSRLTGRPTTRSPSWFRRP